MNVIKEFEIIQPSQEFNEPPRITKEQMNCLLHYDYETEKGNYDWKRICFVKTIAYRFTTFSATSVDMVAAYNAVGRVTNSNWLKELRNNISDHSDEYKHFIVYFEEYGCYEFISQDFIPE